MSSRDELLNFLREQIEVEERIVNSLNNSLPRIRNQVVKGVLRSVSLDSVKHGKMYKAAIMISTEVAPPLKQENLDEQRKLVEEHMKMEAVLIKKIGEKLPDIRSKKIKLLLEAILADERRHHRLLNDVLQILVRGETVTEDDWWDLIWKEVLFHGSPGG